MILANNTTAFDSQDIIVQVDTDEIYSITATVETALLAEATISNFDLITLQSLELGQTNLIVRVSIVGYESFYTEKVLPISIVNFASDVQVNNYTQDRDLIIFDTYNNGMGEPLAFIATPSTAYSKKVLLQIEADNLDKVALKYSDGTPVVFVLNEAETNETVLLERCMTI